MTSQNEVLLIGATGETGGDILAGLLEDGSYKITALIRPASASKAQLLKERGIEVLIFDLELPIHEVAKAIAPFPTIICSLDNRWETESKLADAAAKAGTCKRFVPCGFTTVAPPNGAMLIRDWKEKVHQRIWYHHLPYTFIDVGYWHQISFFKVPSGKFDYAAILPDNYFFGDDDPKNLLTDKRDIGRFVARIIKDPRTLNQKVFTHSDALTQHEILSIIERATGEKISYTKISTSDLLKAQGPAQEAFEKDPNAFSAKLGRFSNDYAISKYVRGDNTPEVAKYLGYLDAKALYPDFKPISFAKYIDELVAGKGQRPYPQGLGGTRG